MWLKKSSNIHVDERNNFEKGNVGTKSHAGGGKEGSFSLDGVPSLDYGWVYVCPNQGNQEKFISIVGFDKIFSAFKTLLLGICH